ncbi:MAG: hypothetical protein M0Q44_22055 [Methylobacter sp.]|nr:hypothetical protein [Methylobacter sp.]
MFRSVMVFFCCLPWLIGFIDADSIDLDEIIVCFLVASSNEAAEWALLFDLDNAMDCLLFFNLAAMMVCFLVGLDSTAGFFCAVNLAAAVFLLLLADFDDSGVFLLLGLGLTAAVGIFVLTDLVCAECWEVVAVCLLVGLVCVCPVTEKATLIPKSKEV